MMIIEVTRKDIEQGVRRSDVRCPLALAINRQLSLAPQVTGGVEAIPEFILYWSALRKKYFRARLPHAASTFLMRFDAGYNVSPIRFPFDETPIREALAA